MSTDEDYQVGTGCDGDDPDTCANGTFVYCGFKPTFVLVKDMSTLRSWRLESAVSAPYNPVAQHLNPDLNVAEYDGNEDIDFLSNGFKLRDVDAGKNGSGLVYYLTDDY